MSVSHGCCFICRMSLDEGQIVVVKKRGINSLIEVSIKRNLPENKFFLANLDEVTVHDACRKRYTAPKNVITSEKRGGNSVPQVQATVALRSSHSSYDLGKICILCGETITQQFLELQKRLPQNRRNMVFPVTLDSTRASFLQEANRRGDEWGKQIIERLTHNSEDLVAADARYHKLCHTKLYCRANTTGQKRGRPKVESVQKALESIDLHLEENSEECQFSLNDLLGQIEGENVPDVRTIKQHLIERYNDDIVIVSGEGRPPVICFKNTGHKILYDKWYDEKKDNPREERLRIVKAASEIILEDIRSQVYETDHYLPSDDFLADVESVVPESVLLFYETIVLKNKNKRKPISSWKRKCITFSHALISAARPTSFVSSLLTSVGTYLYRKFGSRNLVNLCSSLGFSCSYNDATQLETSAIIRGTPSPPIEKGAFMQFVFDNADINVSTLDGENTFHEMGGIMCVTPFSAVLPDKNIPRLKQRIAAESIDASAAVQLQQCTVKKNSGLSAISIIKVPEDFPVTDEILPTAPDLIWSFGKWRNTPGVPGWNGFMEQVTDNIPFQRSKVIFLPFIRAPPTDYDTILTALVEANKKTKAHGQNSCFITFDQPLYMKARDIVESSNRRNELNNVVVRLGGFHLLMSFMGCIGAIMAGSGLKDLFAEIYADNSVDKMLNGHAYARAVRAHTLVNLVLCELILNKVQLTENEQKEMEILLNETQRSSVLKAEEREFFHNLQAKFKSALDNVELNGPTSKLWIQYFRLTVLMKQFIQAERMGDWKLHLQTVGKMLPFFHSAGHFFYAKSARLYLQDMAALEQRMDPAEFSQFTQGNFTVRRADKFWSGLWSDLTIEQTLMRSMKSKGGLVGRGLSSSVLGRWTVGAVYMVNICEEVERFCKLSCSTTEQHIDMRVTRVLRDTKDAEMLKNWFDDHPPFPITDKIVSISSGIVGGGDVNCYKAKELGTKGVVKIENQTFGKVGFKRKDKVVTLASVNNCIKMKNKKIEIDPLTIFQRVCITKKSDSELKDHFQYELAPYPMSLFNEAEMRKGTKSALYSSFTPLTTNIPQDAYSHIVLDGGYLLHKFIWHRNTSVKAIIDGYIHFVKTHFGTDVTVVFDGYPEDASQKSTKSAERLRRYSAFTCSNIVLSSTTIINVGQDKFLSNDTNKRRLIEVLSTGFRQYGIEVKVSVEDADAEIVRTAITKASSSSFDNVIIIGEDVDLLVLLVGLGSQIDNLYFQKCGRGVPDVYYSTKSLTSETSDYLPGVIMFIHAISGCDTTSAPFWQGKNKFVSTFTKKPGLLKEGEIFLNPDATHDEIAVAGEKCLVAVYGGEADVTLNDLRYLQFVRSAATGKANLARLPPTTHAAKQHAYRAYHQVQKWLGFEKNPTEWGWKLDEMGLTPILTTSNAAPQTLLKLISCKCKKGCAGGCSCRKAGLNCSILCTFCRTMSCQNVPLLQNGSSSSEEDNVDL